MRLIIPFLGASLGLLFLATPTAFAAEVLLGCFDPPEVIQVFDESAGIPQTNQARIWIQFPNDLNTALGEGYTFYDNSAGVRIMFRPSTESDFTGFAQRLVNGGGDPVGVFFMPSEGSAPPAYQGGLENEAFELGVGADFSGDTITRVRLVIQNLQIEYRGPNLAEVTHDVKVEIYGERSCPTDSDRSGDTGIDDFLAVLAGWGACPSPCPIDTDGSGDVGVLDFLNILTNWGDCP